MFQSKTTSDSRVVLAVLRGRREDFSVLVRRYLPAVHAVAYARLGNASDADDVAQDVFVRAFQRLETLRDRRKFGPWLMSIARNTTMQLLRSRAREAEIVAELPAPPPSVDPDVEQRELRETLHRAILQLDADQRELLLLRYFSGLSIRELATLLEITPNAAKKRVQRARETLGQQMFDRIEEAGAMTERDDQVKRIMGAVLALPVPVQAAAAAGATALVAKVIAGCVAAAMVGGGALYMAGRDEHDATSVVGENHLLGSDAIGTGSATPSVDRDEALPEATPAEQTEVDASADVATGSIVGRVYDAETNEAVTSLEMALLREGLEKEQENPDRIVVTDESGAYRLGDLPPGAYRFQKPRLNSYPYGELDELVEVRAGETLTYDLTLRNAGVAISGVVKDEHGEPLSGVAIGGMTNQENRWHNAESASDGSFRIVGFGSGGTGFELTASMSGYAMPMVQDLTVPQAGLRGVELTMYEEATVSGKVINPAGKPVVGIGIAAWPMTGGDGTLGSTETREDGTFTITSLFPGEHRIVLAYPGGRSWSISNEVARVVLESAEKRTGLVLVRAPEGEYRISGRVINSERKPILATNLSIHQPVIRSAQSDEDGSFTFEELPEGSYTIQVEDYSNSMRRSKSVDGIAAGATDVEIVLERPAKLRGVVVDESTGKPITQFDLVSEPGLLDEINGHIMWQYKPYADAEGEFELDGVGQGDNTLFARADGFAEAIHHVLALDAGESREGIAIAMSRGVTVEGRVVNSLRQPIPYALVYLGPIPEQQMRTHMAMAETDEEGRFTVHVAPGDVQTLSAYHTSYAPAEKEVRLSGSQVNGVEIVLPEGATIEGVVSRGAVPVPGEAVVLRFGEVHMGSVNTDGRGMYRFEHVPPGEGSVMAYLQEGTSEFRHIKRDFIVSGDETLNVDLAANAEMGTLTGQVTRQGEPVADVQLELSAVQSSGATFGYSKGMRRDGTYLFERVPAGPVLLELIWHDGEEEFTLYQAAVEIPDSGTVVHDIALEE